MCVEWLLISPVESSGERLMLSPARALMLPWISSRCFWSIARKLASSSLRKARPLGTEGDTAGAALVEILGVGILRATVRTTFLAGAFATLFFGTVFFGGAFGATFLTATFWAVALAATFFTGSLAAAFGAAFFNGDFFEVGLITDFLATGFLVTFFFNSVFFAAGFLTTVFFTSGFLGATFLGAAFFAVGFGVGREGVDVFFFLGCGRDLLVLAMGHLSIAELYTRGNGPARPGTPARVRVSIRRLPKSQSRFRRDRRAISENGVLPGDIPRLSPRG